MGTVRSQLCLHAQRGLGSPEQRSHTSPAAHTLAGTPASPGTHTSGSAPRRGPTRCPGLPPHQAPMLCPGPTHLLGPIPRLGVQGLEGKGYCSRKVPGRHARTCLVGQISTSTPGRQGVLPNFLQPLFRAGFRSSHTSMGHPIAY